MEDKVEFMDENMQNIFVFRISKGHNGGDPLGSCPMDYSDALKRRDEVTKEQFITIDYETNGHLDFVKQEFWQNATLRQGWGIKGLDLNQSAKDWIANYIYNGKIYWHVNIKCEHAKGRYNIINRMRLMKKNDIILIPKTSKDKLDDPAKFTVCQIDEPYYFDFPEDMMDFGHCVKVKNQKEFFYGAKTLQSGDFGTPYLWAVTEVRKYHRRYKKFDQFIQNEFLR